MIIPVKTKINETFIKIVASKLPIYLTGKNMEIIIERKKRKIEDEMNPFQIESTYFIILSHLVRVLNT